MSSSTTATRRTSSIAALDRIGKRVKEVAARRAWRAARAGSRARWRIWRSVRATTRGHSASWGAWRSDLLDAFADAVQRRDG